MPGLVLLPVAALAMLGVAFREEISRWAWFSGEREGLLATAVVVIVLHLGVVAVLCIEAWRGRRK